MLLPEENFKGPGNFPVSENRIPKQVSWVFIVSLRSPQETKPPACPRGDTGAGTLHWMPGGGSSQTAGDGWAFPPPFIACSPLERGCSYHSPTLDFSPEGREAWPPWDFRGRSNRATWPCTILLPRTSEAALREQRQPHPAASQVSMEASKGSLFFDAWGGVAYRLLSRTQDSGVFK